ncbi:MAG: tetratricopeptide repeat protein [Bryobacterales bacterium]|nr:tetratricopeptide repeat protein [Bryobacterales bacterium]
MKTIWALLAAGLLAEAQSNVMSVSVNGGMARIGAGSPLLVNVSLVGEIAGTDLEGTRLNVVDEDGNAVDLALQARSELTRVVNVLGVRSVMALWTASPEQGGALRPGRYAVTASVGDLRARTHFDVAADLPADLAMLSRWEQMEGRLDRALELASQVLSENPQSTAAVLRKVDLLEQKDDYGEALRVVEAAIFSPDEADGNVQVPPVLHFRRKALLKRVLGGQEGEDPE